MIYQQLTISYLSVQQAWVIGFVFESKIEIICRDFALQGEEMEGIQ